MDSSTGKIIFTKSQQKAFDKIISFIESRNQKVFILKGYAGTGKTTMVRAIIAELISQEKPFTLLASTGRAAKILSDSANKITKDDNDDYVLLQAKTIHSEIYTFGGLNQELDLFGQPNRNSELGTDKGIKLRFVLKHKVSFTHTIYIVDEASMISDISSKYSSQAVYGIDGKLLSDLLEYDENGQFIFIGDSCQLPPINQSFSPALSKEYFYTQFNIDADEAELTDIVRQSSGNDIALSASVIRKRIFSQSFYNVAKLKFRGYKNIKVLSSEVEMLKLYIESVRLNGYTKSTLITMSNRKIADTSTIIRYSLQLGNSNLSVNDLLLVTQNNSITGLMNGDLVSVLQIKHKERRAGLTFVSVEVESLATKRVYNSLLIEEILYSGLTNITQTQQTHIMIDFHYRMKEIGIKQHSEEYDRKMMKDDYLNALRCVYGYVLTCHKAQGGEWDNVFLLIPRNMPYMKPQSFIYQWVYTAMTRAKQTLYVINDYWVE